MRIEVDLIGKWVHLKVRAFENVTAYEAPKRLVKKIGNKYCRKCTLNKESVANIKDKSCVNYKDIKEENKVMVQHTPYLVNSFLISLWSFRKFSKFHRQMVIEIMFPGHKNPSIRCQASKFVIKFMNNLQGIKFQ